MAKGDITFLRAGAFGLIGTRTYKVAASATVINAGEPVNKKVTYVAGANLSTAVIPAVTLSPNIGTTFIIGIAESLSTNTATAEGTVSVLPCVPGVIYLCAPLTAASWNTQAKYDALVGTRVVFDLTSSTYTISLAGPTNVGNGLVVEPLNIATYPGLVAFSVRNQALYNN